jgi:hypothetical protein
MEVQDVQGLRHANVDGIAVVYLIPERVISYDQEPAHRLQTSVASQSAEHY